MDVRINTVFIPLLVIEDLKCEHLDTVILSLPPTSDCAKQTFRTIQYQELKVGYVL